MAELRPEVAAALAHCDRAHAELREARRLLPLSSHDGGARWQPLALGDPDANLVFAAWPPDARHGVAVMLAPNSEATLFEITSDGGRTWAERPSWLVG